jgi:hypothetical protein
MNCAVPPSFPIKRLHEQKRPGVHSTSQRICSEGNLVDFCIDHDLLTKAHDVLAGQKRLYWIVGGACSGKSTACQALSIAYGVPIYDMDAHIFDDYPQRCTAERHPSLRTWFTAPDPFAWMLGLAEDEFTAFNRSSNAEYLDLIADDLRERARDETLLVDGGFTHPALLTQVVDEHHIVCLETTEAASIRAWEESSDRQFMKEMVLRLPDPQESWRKFLRFDRLITGTILKECRENGIHTIKRDESGSVAALTAQIAGWFGIGEASGS